MIDGIQVRFEIQVKYYTFLHITCNGNLTTRRGGNVAWALEAIHTYTIRTYHLT